MLSLTRNKKPLDLPPDLGVSLEYRNPLFDPIGEPAKTFSYGLDIPTTAKNQLAFGFPESLHTRNNLTVAPGELFYNGSKLLEGDLLPVKANTESYRVSLQQNIKLAWAEEGIDMGIARDSGAITLHEPEMVFTRYDTIYPIINTSGNAATQCQQLNLRETLEWVAAQNNWSITFDWDALFDELYLFAPAMNNAISPRGSIFDGDTNRQPLPSFYQIIYNLQKLIGLYIVFDYNLQKVSIQMLKDVIEVIQKDVIRISDRWEKEYNKTNEGLRLVFGDNEEMQTDDFDFLYGGYNEEGDEVTTECYLLPKNNDDRLVYTGRIPTFAFRGPVVDPDRANRGQSARPTYKVPLAIYFKTGATTGSYISTSGQSLELPELGPVYWDKYIALFQNSETIVRTLYLDFNQVRNLNPLTALYIEGNRYLYQKIEVQVPNKSVKYFQAKATLLRID
jgi:hypothetical protein